MKKILLSSKASILLQLQPLLKSAQILPVCVFTQQEWKDNKKKCLERLSSLGARESFIVRSSGCTEDKCGQSKAGAYLSLLHISIKGIAEAVDKVFASFGPSLRPEDEVLIQSMLTNVIRSGVAFSHDPHSKTCYNIINWTEGQDTTLVTSGKEAKTWQLSSLVENKVPPELKKIVALLKELKNILADEPIDCEFAIASVSGEEEVYLFQVRSLFIDGPLEKNLDHVNRLKTIYQYLLEKMQPHPWLVGKTTFFGVMPDWNPAEIIGLRPRPLALSLYSELVTDSIWAYQRNNYGYRNLRSHPLLISFFGMPYVDIRVSFNSFIPSSLSEEIAEKLVNYYLDELKNEPTLHDKVEFNIVFSSFSFNLPQRLGSLKTRGFSESEIFAITESLKTITNKITHPDHGLWLADAEKIKTLKERQHSLNSSNLNPVEKVYWLLEDIKRYGTLPFAGLARAAFIAVQMLKSLVDSKIFTQTEYEDFMSSIKTITSEISADRGQLNRHDFLLKYGHLRPGTYDILSPRYDEEPDLYFNWDAKTSIFLPKQFHARPQQLEKITELCLQYGIEHTGLSFLQFARDAISLREESKFHFTRSLSQALVLINEIGKGLGFSTDDLSYSNVSAFQALMKSILNASDIVGRSIESGKLNFQETKHLSMPPLILKPEDVFSFQWPETSPNFITQKTITGDVTTKLNKKDLSGKIVFISNADPGFDWIFDCGIVGLVTAWGGANSHMAIRALELGIPAVIGAGEEKFKRWSNK